MNRRLPLAPPLRATLVCIVSLAAPMLAGCSGCHGAAGNDAGPAPSASSSAGSFLTRRAPLTGAPSAPGAPEVINPKARREPDWDLDSSDPARDYAVRYAQATLRYGEPSAASCMIFSPSQAAGNQRRVEVKTGPGCPGGAGTVRDVFLVDVAGDRLAVDDPTKRDPLAKWPDGSTPDGPASPEIREIDRMQDWKSPMQDAVRRQLLVPVRVQAYGRGSYPVISIAGWHGDIQVNAPADKLKPLADALCATGGGAPVGILAAIDRTHILRIRCPASTRWEEL